MAARAAWIAVLIWAIAVGLFVWSRRSQDLRAAGSPEPAPESAEPAVER